MPVSIFSEQASQSPANEIASSLASLARGVTASVETSRDRAAIILWSGNQATPPEVLAEYSAESRAQLMVGDVASRILLALREPDALAAFAASSPVPPSYRVDLLDANGAPVDISAEVAALLVKLGSVRDASAVAQG